MKRRITANPDEPSTGDFAYGISNAAHPVTGRSSTLNYLDKQLDPFYGREVRVRIAFGRIDPDSGDVLGRVNATRTFELNEYSDMFGPGSAYADALHAVKSRHSPDELVVYSFTIEDV